MEKTNTPPSVIHKFDSNTGSRMAVSLFLILIAVALLIGTGLGFLPSKLKTSKTATKTEGTTAKSVGIADKKTFNTSAEGVLKEGGINGEGNFHLERPGGESQNVYLTSTAVDLSQFVGKKIKVWGETFQGQTAGWLMDVGLVETLK